MSIPTPPRRPFPLPTDLRYRLQEEPLQPRSQKAGKHAMASRDLILLSSARKTKRCSNTWNTRHLCLESSKATLVTTTVRDYDLSETSKFLRSAYMGIAMMGVMHVYFKFTQPLFIQALMGVKNLYDAKPIAIYIFGKPAPGDLKKPFKVASMFGRECSLLVIYHSFPL
ncbi:hypothetical protein D9613_012842 [Agrocybe pediades]|uniref:Uncharacterized protein n=1 Tax=Agrocybe pediades TaxID=84607 RepID=A0A8H4QWK5_9AGAR|nr:hypothetical protein D9613_012842 [Agrocybe pediades]